MVELVSAGTVEYPSGSESASFTLPLDSGAGAAIAGGDVLVLCVTAATSDAAATPPAGSTVVLATSSHPDGNYSGGVFVWPVPAVKPSSMVATWDVARRGSLAWAAFRGVDTTTPVDAAASSAWLVAGATSKDAPAVTTSGPDRYLVSVVQQPSGSAAITPPAGWTQLTDATERDGHIATRGVQAAAGTTGAATFSVSSVQVHRLTQLALTPLTSNSVIVDADLVSDPYPAATGDVADGAAIVRRADSPADSLVIGTSKAVGGGLYVLDLAGQILSSNLDGAANSVDWRDTSGLPGWDDRLLVATVDRDNNRLRFYWLSWATRALTAAGSTALGYEPYGSCLLVHAGTVHMAVSDRGAGDTGTHTIYWYPLSRSGETVTSGAAIHTITAEGVMEGMAGDDPTGDTYVSREDYGLYCYQWGSATPLPIDTVTGGLVADVEDVAIARRGSVAWVVVSSQGDSSLHLYRDGEHRSRFVLTRAGTPVVGTDGLDLTLDPLGAAWPNGLLVVHDSGGDPSRFVFVDPARFMPAGIDAATWAGRTITVTGTAGITGWDWGDGTTSLGSLASHTYTTDGLYQVQLTDDGVPVAATAGWAVAKSPPSLSPTPQREIRSSDLDLPPLSDLSLSELFTLTLDRIVWRRRTADAWATVTLKKRDNNVWVDASGVRT